MQSTIRRVAWASLSRRAPLHTTRPLLSSVRLENEDIPFHSAILVKHPSLRDVDIPAGSLTQDVQSTAEADPVESAPSDLQPPDLQLFRPSTFDIQFRGQHIDVATFLKDGLDRKAHKLELARIAPTPVVVLVPNTHTHTDAAHHRHTTNEKIPYRVAWLKRSEGARLKEIDVQEYLQSLDRSQFKLELVTEEPKPIVRVVNKADERKARQEAKEHKKAMMHHGQIKQFHFTWCSEPHDVEHKLNMVRHALDRGQKCDLVFKHKGESLCLSFWRMKLMILR